MVLGARVQLDCIRPGKPAENGLSESFNRRLRDECLNVNQFTSLDHARATQATWQDDHSQHRPHDSLEHLTPTNSPAEVGKSAKQRPNSDSELMRHGGTVSL